MFTNTNKEKIAGLEERIEVTDRSVVQKLRKIVEPAGKRGNWLRLLSDRQLVEIYHRLRLNHSINHIAKIAQKEWGILPSSETRSLCRAIRSLRDQVVGLLQIHEQSHPKSLKKQQFVENEEKRAEKIVKTIDGMAELAWLIQVQRGRLESMIDREKLGTPSKWTDKTVEQLRECVDTYLRYAEDLGLIDVKPKKLNLEFKSTFDGLLDNVIRDDGSRFISAATRFLELAKQKALTMKKTSDGGYEIEENKGAEFHAE